MYHPILRTGAQRQLKRIGEADIVVGLPTYKNTQAATQVARVALEGLSHYYPHLRTVLINADAGHAAATRRAVVAQASNGHAGLVVSGRYDGTLGQGSAIAALLDAALALDARAIVILDSQSESITPAWIAALVDLILHNQADLVIPRYRQWLQPAGILSDLILYPLFRVLWGHNIRRPAAPDFALSPQLATALLDEDVWGTAIATSGFPPWLATYGVLRDWRVAQSAVGEKYQTTFDMSVSKAQFESHFRDVLSVMFSLVYKYQSRWQGTNSVCSLPTLTRFASEPHPISARPEDVVDLLDQVALGWIEYRTVWRRVLTPDNLSQLEALAALPPDQFYFPADLWARIIYDFVVVFNKGEVDPPQVIDALFPLYQGRLAAFWQEVAGLAPVGREGTVAAQAVEFEESFSYLQRRWQAYLPSR